MQYIINEKLDEKIKFEGHEIKMSFRHIFDDIDDANKFATINKLNPIDIKPVKYIAYAVITEADTIKGLATAEPFTWWENYYYDLKEAQKELEKFMLDHNTVCGIKKFNGKWEKHQNYVIDVDY